MQIDSSDSTQAKSVDGATAKDGAKQAADGQDDKEADEAEGDKVQQFLLTRTRNNRTFLMQH